MLQARIFTYIEISTAIAREFEEIENWKKKIRSRRLEQKIKRKHSDHTILVKKIVKKKTQNSDFELGKNEQKKGTDTKCVKKKPSAWLLAA